MSLVAYCPICNSEGSRGSICRHPEPQGDRYRIEQPDFQQPEAVEHKEARRLAGKLLTENERKLAKASWAYGVVADPNIPKWGNLVLEAYDAAAALLASLEAQLLKAEQERDEALVVSENRLKALRMAEADRDLSERELERLREAICAKAHHFPPDAVGGDSCYCGKVAW